MLGAYCNRPTCHNDLFMKHYIETLHETNEEQRDAVLCYLLNGICIFQLDVPWWEYFARRLPSAMNLSDEVFTLLLSSCKGTRVTLCSAYTVRSLV